MTSPTLNFGRHRGKSIADVPEHYLRWLVDPARGKPQPEQPSRPLPKAIVDAAADRLKAIEDEKLREQFAQRCLGGHPTGVETPIFVIECEGDCYSKSGRYSIYEKWFPSLEQTLDFLSAEYPMQPNIGGENPDQIVRATPDPEDDKIVIWEVLPTGHRKAVWGFFGWHHSSSAESYACGQSSLPGDSESLFSLAMAED